MTRFRGGSRRASSDGGPQRSGERTLTPRRTASGWNPVRRGCSRSLATSLAGPATAVAADASLSPATRLAAMLKEALAANTIGGKVDDDSRARGNGRRPAGAGELSRVGQVPDEVRRPLAE